MRNKAYYIILDNTVLLSKKEYSDWHEIQDEYYESYKTSFPPVTCNELLQYFEEDFKEEINWPFTKESIIKFFENNEMILLENNGGM